MCQIRGQANLERGNGFHLLSLGLGASTVTTSAVLKESKLFLQLEFMLHGIIPQGQNTSLPPSNRLDMF